MSKYVIELDENVKVLQSISVTPNGNAYTNTQWLANLEELNSDYINEHFGDLQDTAYHRGLEEGSFDVKQRVEGAYQRGLEDAWECARKLFSSMADSDIEKAFPIEWNNGGFNALMNLQPQEAIAKLKAYEEKQKADNCIEIGDEVKWNGDKYIVTYRNIDINTGVIKDYDLMMWNGSVVNHVKKCSFVKTGNHYDIASILKEMKE